MRKYPGCQNSSIEFARPAKRSRLEIASEPHVGRDDEKVSYDIDHCPPASSSTITSKLDIITPDAELTQQAETQKLQGCYEQKRSTTLQVCFGAVRIVF